MVSYHARAQHTNRDKKNVRRIVLAEPVPDPDHGNKPSRKYLSLVVDLGNEKRRVVSAVRAIVDVEDAIG